MNGNCDYPAAHSIGGGRRRRGDDALSHSGTAAGTQLNNKRQRDFTNGLVMWLCCGRTPNFSITLNSADTSDTLASFVGQHIFALFSQRSNVE